MPRVASLYPFGYVGSHDFAWMQMPVFTGYQNPVGSEVFNGLSLYDRLIIGPTNNTTTSQCPYYPATFPVSIVGIYANFGRTGSVPANNLVCSLYHSMYDVYSSPSGQGINFTGVTPDAVATLPLSSLPLVSAANNSPQGYSSSSIGTGTILDPLPADGVYMPFSTPVVLSANNPAGPTLDNWGPGFIWTIDTTPPLTAVANIVRFLATLGVAVHCWGRNDLNYSLYIYSGAGMFSPPATTSNGPIGSGTYSVQQTLSNGLIGAPDLQLGPVAAGVPFYRNFNAMAGLHYDGSAHHQFGHPMDGATLPSGAANPGGIDWIRGLLSATDNSSKVYAWAIDPTSGNCFCYRSLDSGATWTQMGQFPGRAGQAPDANGSSCQPTNQVWVADHTDNALTGRGDGVWRSTDDAATWSRILPCEGTVTVNFMSGSTPTSQNAPRGCFSAAMGASKLWFCWQTSGVYSNSPYPSPPQGTATYQIEQSGPDGSGRATIGSITLYAPSQYSSAHDNLELPLRPWQDALVLVASSGAPYAVPPAVGTGMLWLLTSGGALSQIPPPGGAVLDAVPLGATTFLALTWQPAGTVSIYRSTDSGTTWTLQRTLSGHEYAGWGLPVAIAADTYGCWQILPVPGTNGVFVNGGQGSVGPGAATPNQNAPLMTWYSPDLGVTWAAVTDTTAPTDATNHWMNGRQLGLAVGAAAHAPPAQRRTFATVIGD